MPVIGANLVDPYSAFNFVIEIHGLQVGGFSECMGLQVETEVHRYREGGVNEYEHVFWGPTKYPPLVLKHGITAIDGLWNWYLDVLERKIERLSGTIHMLDKQHQPAIRWDFKEAIPTKWTGPELRADSGTIAFESIELIHRGLSRPIPANE